LAARNRNIALSDTVRNVFDNLTRVGVANECERQLDGQTERPLAIARSNWVRRVIKAIASEKIAGEISSKVRLT